MSQSPYVLQTTTIPADFQFIGQGAVSFGISDDHLEDFLQPWLVGCSMLPGSLVRPSYQQNPPPLPPKEATWLAFNIQRGTNDWDPVVSLDGLTTARIEELSVSLSYYGPVSEQADNQVRGSILLNRGYLQLGAMSYVSYGQPTTSSEMIKGEFVRRIDVELVLRRTVQFTYAVATVFSLTGEIISDAPPVAIDLKPKP